MAHVLWVYRVLGVRGDVPGAARLPPAGLEAPVRGVQRGRAPAPPHVVVRKGSFTLIEGKCEFNDK